MAYYRVPPPYQFRLDFGWACVIAMLVLGLLHHPAWWLWAGILTLVRCAVWLAFRFPMTAMFVVGIMRGFRR